MNGVLITALVARIKAGGMTLEQVPIPYQAAVTSKVSGDGEGESE